MIDFAIQLKTGTDKDALAYVVAYSKHFTGHRFVYSTGLKVPRKGFNAARPGKHLKGIVEIADKAYESILADGAPLNNTSLKARIELFRNRLQWTGNELQVFDGKTIQRFQVPEDVDKGKLAADLQQEQLKANPNLKKVVEAAASLGTSELFGFWKAVLDGSIKPRNGKPLRKSTVIAKQQTYRLVKEFKPSATFEVMDRKFYNDLTSWLKSEKDLDDNTIGRHIKELKSILHLASANELISDARFSYWPVLKLKNEVVPLSKDELLKIVDVKLSGTIADVRDIFVLACFSGARISDFKKFTRENVVTQGGISYLEYVAEKTGTRVRVPLLPIATSIIQKRGGELPKMIAEQNFRSYVKDIAKKALYDPAVESGTIEEGKSFNPVVTKIRSGKPQYEEKYKAISPHSARRTFASSLYYGWFGRPMPAALCMKYTGHATEASFLLYIGANEKDLEAKALEYFDFNAQMKVS